MKEKTKTIPSPTVSSEIDFQVKHSTTFPEGEGARHIKGMGMFVVSLSGLNCGCRSQQCSRQNANTSTLQSLIGFQVTVFVV